MWFTAALSLCVQIVLYLGCVAYGATVTIAPQLVVAPVNSTVSFNCTVANSKGDVRWYITLANATIKLWPMEASALQGVVSNASNTKYNVTLNGTVAVQSTLYVAAVQRTSGTAIQCGVLSDNNELVSSAISSLIVYDRPPPPTSIRARILGELQLEISWSPAVPIPGVVAWYTVHVRDLTAMKDVLDARVTNSSYVHQHSLAQGPLCNLYQFTVVAGNAAGVSGPGAPLVTTIPSNPVLGNVTSVVHYLSGNVSVQIWIKSAAGCPNFTIQGYRVHLEDVSSTLLLDASNRDGNNEAVINVTAGLHINTKYTVTVRGFNSVGESSNISLLVYTTDVQSLTITGSDHQLNVTCFFAEGTLAKGCGVCLEKSGEVVYQRIPRVNGTAKGVIRTEFSVDCYNISVVDWEEDGSIGSLGVPVKPDIYTVDCNKQGNPAGKGVVNGPAILVPLVTGALVAIVAVLCLAICLILVVMVLRRRDTFGIDHTSINTKQSSQPTAALQPKSPDTEERIYDTVAEDSSDYSTLNIHLKIVVKKCPSSSNLEYSQVSQHPSYAVLEACHPACSASNVATPLYSEISPPHQQCHSPPVLTREDDPQPYLCVSQVSDACIQSECGVGDSVTEI